MSHSQPVIGIIGGMGPLAGADLFRKIIENVEASTDQEHPPVILMSFPHRLPDRTAYLTGASSKSPAPAIANIIRTLDRLDVAVVGMPCNTAHSPSILDPVMVEMRRHSCRIHFVHMIDATVAHVREIVPEAERIGVLSTTGTRRTGLYRDALAAAGFEVIELDDDEHEALANRAVYDPAFGIKARSAPVDGRARKLVIDGIERLETLGAEAVILGCTELPLAVPKVRHAGVRLVDPATALARALIGHTHPHRLRPLPTE